MDTRTGKMYQFENEDEKKEIEAELGRKLRELAPEEFNRLQSFSPEQRPEETALRRFIESRKALGAPHGLPIQNAFRLGYRASQDDAK
jgi:hypothetical protein